MSGQIPESFIDDLRHRVDIVDVISEYVPLKKKGQNYVGLCPFHAEKTPSFVVSPQKQIYHCFGCGKGGNAFSFVMEKNAVSFPEAVTILAKRCGIALPQTYLSPDRARKDSLKNRYYEINLLAVQFYQQMLGSEQGRNAYNYLIRRKLKPDAINKFMLGFAPQNWDQLSRFLLNKGVTGRELVLLGLAVEAKNGNLVDRFRNRVMFPIFDYKGRIIGFGGRVLDNTQPKYLNSPDTPLFQKGRHIYGIHFAKSSIRLSDKAVIMEGYMDVITAHQNNIEYAVGALGTALTIEQAKAIMRYSYNAYICFDADSAGQNAALRGLDICKKLGCRVWVMTVPGAKDPDEYIQKEGQEGFFRVIEEAKTLLEYKLTKLLEDHNTDTVPGKIQVIQELIDDILKEQSPVARQAFIQLLSDRLNIPESAIHAEMKKEIEGKNSFQGELTNKEKRKEVKSAEEKAQRTLLRIALEKPEFIQEIEKSGGEGLFSNKIIKEIYQGNYLMLEAGHNIKANDLVSLLDNREAQQELTEILLEEEISDIWKRIAKDCLALLKLEHIKKDITEKSVLMSHYEKSGEISKSIEMMSKIQALIKEKQMIATSLRKGGNDGEN